MKVKIATLAASVLSLSLFMTACTKHDHDHDDHNHDEEELITKVKLKFYQQGAFIEDFVFDDPDGVGGGNAPKIDTIKLSPNQIYDSVTVEFSNPNEDKTPEIRAEANDHELFYDNIAPLDIVYSDYDKDGNGLKLGLKAKWETKNAVSGKVRLTLKHKPGTKAANDPVTKGETEIEVEFPVKVE